jgi:hypothetical protein
VNEYPTPCACKSLTTDYFSLCGFQSGKELTVKGIRALEYVSKETLDILASETGFDLEADEKSPEEETTGKESYTEDVTFDHCFYIYGGPEHLEVGSSSLLKTSVLSIPLFPPRLD